MRFKASIFSIGLLPVFLCIALSFAALAEDKPGPEEAVFEMREVSAFDKSDVKQGRLLTRGQLVGCSTEPDKEVKAYPKLKSSHPLYGKIKFYINPATKEGIEYHFVLDESGEEPNNEQDKNAEKKQEPSLLKSLTEKLFGPSGADRGHLEWHAALSGYDRLYFDVNNDLDLTNDTVLKPMKNPPWSSLIRGGCKEQTAFEYLNLDFDYGPEIGKRPFKIMPWFTASEYDNKTYYAMSFVATAAREGIIQMGEHKYDAILAQPYAVTGRFDNPGTALYLTPLGSEERIDSGGFGGDMLMTAHQIDGELYTIAATPLGDKLTVKPYRGDFGVFRIGAGERDVKEFSFQGSFGSQTMAISFKPALNTPAGQEEKIKECKLPVGDYLSSYITINYGRLRIGFSDNYHSDGKPQNFERSRTYGIKIRKDEPFVFDFSNKPEVLFARPAKDKTFKPGEEVSVKAVLIDPVLDIMIRRLDNTTPKKKEAVKLGDGQEAAPESTVSLDPTVTITDSSGKTVAEGTMPFG